MVHILFNTAGVAIWIGLIAPLAELIRWISPVAEGLQGSAALAAETPRQIANAHTFFNVANTLLFIGFTPLLARGVEWMVPDRPMGARDETPDRRYLDDILVHTPALALDLVRMELTRIGASVLRMVRGAIDPVLTGTAQDLEDLRKLDDEIDRLHGALVTYMGRLSTENLTEAQSHLLSRYLGAANYYENMGDLIETNLFEAGRTRLTSQLDISPSTREVLRDLHDKVQWAVERATEALASEDPELAQEVIDAKSEADRLAEGAAAHLATRLTAAAPHRLAAYRIETELVETLRRLYDFAKRISRLVVEETALYSQQIATELGSPEQSSEKESKVA